MNKLDLLLQTVVQIHKLLENITGHGTKNGGKKLPDRLLSAQDVMDKLGISEATYYRHVKNGELKPRIKGNRHYFYEDDLVEALEESRRRGRI
ncbi:AlpA family transcriptional regulator [Olivibacter sp. XZL3]|uniref:helix-turn-helix transcriptional regulator n=1 Tax=Olivibacter sp. XZL3 TaxID=1735116 RepID=UPI001066BD9D|nr:helix-turn-helix domain-containing protein [Olivibacter sp. XZL3]